MVNIIERNEDTEIASLNKQIQGKNLEINTLKQRVIEIYAVLHYLEDNFIDFPLSD